MPSRPLTPTDQLTGKYLRLRSELDAAYAEPDWMREATGRIDRLASELADIERLLAQRGAADAAGEPSRH